MIFHFSFNECRSSAWLKTSFFIHSMAVRWNERIFYWEGRSAIILHDDALGIDWVKRNTHFKVYSHASKAELSHTPIYIEDLCSMRKSMLCFPEMGCFPTICSLFWWLLNILQKNPYKIRQLLDCNHHKSRDDIESVVNCTNYF